MVNHLTIVGENGQLTLDYEVLAGLTTASCAEYVQNELSYYTQECGHSVEVVSFEAEPIYHSNRRPGRSHQNFRFAVLVNTGMCYIFKFVKHFDADGNLTESHNYQYFNIHEAKMFTEFQSKVTYRSTLKGGA